MGWKASMIIIENPDNFQDEGEILSALGKADFQFKQKTTLEECIYPGDDSINLGYYRGNLIICDDYQITNSSLENTADLRLSPEELSLCKLFPKSEIVTVACHSALNYHGYSLIKNGKKKRIKTISADDPLFEMGGRIEEEALIYSKSHQKDGQNYWKYDTDPAEEYVEDQLMEEFTFGVASRRLNIYLDQEDGDELMEEVPFNKYRQGKGSLGKKLIRLFSS